MVAITLWQKDSRHSLPLQLDSDQSILDKYLMELLQAIDSGNVHAARDKIFQLSDRLKIIYGHSSRSRGGVQLPSLLHAGFGPLC